MDRRSKRLVSAHTLARTQRQNAQPQSRDYPPDKPLCLRGHTPTLMEPSRVRVKPRQSVRGPRGATDVQIGAFAKPGVLGGLSVSPWVVQEEAERAQRVMSHTTAISKVGLWRRCVFITVIWRRRIRRRILLVHLRRKLRRRRQWPREIFGILAVRLLNV